MISVSLQSRVVFLMLLLAAGAGCVQAGVLDRVGAMGDSQTDDNLFPAYSSYQNWAMQLSDLRAINFGPYDRYNRAVSGATTGSLLSGGQHTAMVTDNVTLAMINIGGNDLLNGVVVPSTTPSQAAVNNLVNQMISNFDTAVTTVAGPVGAPSGRKMVLFQLVALHRVPIVVEFTRLGMDPVKVDLLKSAQATYNAHIKDLAIAYGFPVIDMHRLVLDVMGTAEAPKTVFMLGDKAINLELHQRLPALPTDGFWQDGLHPNTPLQGIVANLVIEAVNRAYGTDIEHLSDQEIFAVGGGTPTPGLTSYVDITDYIFVPGSPRGDFSGDGDVNVVDLSVLADNWLSDSDVTDITPYPDGDNNTNLLDFAVMCRYWLTNE